MTSEKEKKRFWVLASLFAFTLIPHPSSLILSAHAAFTDLGAGARAPGMGNAFVAVADDVYSVHYNPAGLALMDRPELGASYTRHLMGLSDESNLGMSFIGYAQPLKSGGALAASWQQFNLDGGLYQERALGVSYGKSLLKGFGPGELYGGMSLKNLNRSFGSVPEAGNALNGLVATGRPDPVLSGKRSVNTPDLNLGLLYRLREHYAAGLALTHITQPNVAFERSDPDRLPLGVKAGLNYRSLLSNAGIQYDTLKSPIGSRDHRFTIAAERWLPWLFVGNLGARGALTIGSRNFKLATAGVSYRSQRFAVDYGFSMPLDSIVSIAGTHRLAFSIRFGSAGEAEESVGLILDAMRRLKGGAAPRLEYRNMGLSAAQKKSLEEYLAETRSLEASARYQDALGSLSKALALSPEDADILKSFGRLNFVATMLKSLPDYRTDPGSTAWHQGILAYLSYDDALAVDKVSDALGFNPESKEIDSFLTQLESASGLKRKEALKAPQITAGIDPAQARASQAVEEGRYQDAITLSLQVLSRTPDNRPAWENLGISYFAAGEFRNSLDAFEKVRSLEKDPARRAMLNSHINSILNILKKPKTAAGPAGAGASPREIRSLYDKGLDLYSSGQLEKARDVFEQVLVLDPRYAPAAKALKRVNMELKLK